jgi:hypothetical protein
VADQIIAVFGTLGGVVVGTVLGWWLKARSDRQRELHAEKRAAYVDLIQNLNAFEHSLIPLESASRSGIVGQIPAAAERTREALAHVDAAISVVRLIAPASRDDELAELMTICISSMAHASGVTTERDRADEFHPASRSVLALARAELGTT